MKYFSRAIQIYLADTYGDNDSLYPKDPQQRALVDRMLYFDMTKLYASFSDIIVSNLQPQENYI